MRRQVPESWRRVLPVPLAAGLYGVLLGLGFTTFILTFAVWALAAVSVALGDPALGAVLGLAFGAGRALPVIALAPIADGDRGNAAHAAMAERPAILRGLRAADAVALALCAAVIGVAPAQAERTTPAPRVAGRGRPPPSRAPRRPARRPTRTCSPSSAPAASATCAAAGHVRAPRPRSRARRRARRLARRGADRARRRRARSRPSRTYESPGGGAFAFSDQWVVWLVGHHAARRPAAQATARAARRGDARAAEQLGRPALAGQSLVFHRAGRSGAQIRLLDLGTGAGAACCARSGARCCSTRPSTAASCSTCARPTRARSCGSARPAGARPRATAASTAPPRPARRDAGHEPGHAPPPRRLPGRQARRRSRPARPPASRHAVDHGARAAGGVRHAAAPSRGATTTAAVLSVPR